ncbi:hypothetical protein GCM10027088_63780 [Nocardia goodfellowii]
MVAASGGSVGPKTTGAGLSIIHTQQSKQSQSARGVACPPIERDDFRTDGRFIGVRLYYVANAPARKVAGAHRGTP